MGPAQIRLCVCVSGLHVLLLLSVAQVAALHGELQGGERGAIFEAARNGAYQLLLVSDLAARGLDMPNVSQCLQGLCSKSVRSAGLRLAYQGGMRATKPTPNLCKDSAH